MHGGSHRFYALVALLVACLAQSAIGQSLIQYVYDDVGRLIGVIDPSGDTATYTYDAVGNVLSIDRHASSQVSIISFAPATGPIGTVVTIFGTGFSATTSLDSVTVDGVAAVVSAASPTQLAVSVPVGASTGSIAVTAPSGSATSGRSFTVDSSAAPPTITAFTPASAIAGTSFGIDGTGFDPSIANDRLTVNAAWLAPTSATATHLAASVPSNVASGRLRVSTVYGTGTSTDDLYIAPTGYSAANMEYKARFAGFGSANALTATIASAGNVGVLLFDPVAGHRTSVSIDDVTISLVRISLLSPFGSTVATVVGGTGGTYFFDTAPLVFSGPATYTILVQPVASYTGHARVTINDIVDATGTITAGGTSVTAALATPGQNGRFLFNGTQGRQVSLNVTADSITFANISIVSPDGTTLFTPVPLGTSGGFIDALTLPSSGVYTIVVDPSDARTGSLTLTLFDATEQTGSIATDGTVTGVTTSIPGQNVRLTFTGTAGHRVSLTVGGATPSGTVSVLDRDGLTTLGSATIGIFGTFVEPIPLSVDGTYAVYVNYLSTWTGSVALALYDVPADLSGTITPGGTVPTVTLTTPGQNAVYTIATPVNTRVSLNIGGGGPTGTVLVLRPDGTTLTSGSMNFFTNFLEPWTFVSGQTIRVDPAGFNTGSVGLRVDDVPPDVSGSLSIGGSAVPVTIAAMGQNGALTFSGTSAQQVTVHVTGNTLSGTFGGVTVKLLSTDGTTVLASTSSASGSFNLTTVTLPATGTYTIAIDPAAANVGALNIAVTSP